MSDNKEIFQSGGTSEPKIESASNVNYMDNLYKNMGIASFSNSDNSAYTKFTEKGTNLQNYNFPDINEKNPLSTYTEQGVNIGAGKNYNLQRAQNQTWDENALNAGANAVAKIPFGMVGIAGHLGGLIFDQDGDYENALTTWAKESEEYFTSDSKNYAENPNASFFSGEYWTDPANIFDVIDGVATSAATFAIPGAGAAFTANKIALGLSKILNASAAAKKVGMAMATGASSLTMGYAEAAMSGADIYKEQLEKNLAKGMQYDDAKRIATGAAQTTVRMATIFNTVLNIPILGSFTQKTDDILRKEVGDIVDDLNLRTVDNKGNVVDAVTGKPIDQVKLADQAKDLGGVKQMPDAIKNLPKINEVKDLKAATERLKNIELKPSTWRDVAKAYGKEAGLEFLEEGQIALAEEAGRKYTDPNNTGQNFIKSLKDAFSGIGKEQFWESAALGALGGVGMKALINVGTAAFAQEVSEIDPNITFDAETQTYKTPEGKEVKDNLKRNADGTIIKKRMRASSHDNERKKAMIASEVAYMVEDLSTTQYWQEKMQTIADDFKAGNKVVDVTLPDGKLDKRVMTKGEAAIKIQEAKDQLFNISARRSIMSGKGDNFKLIFQNIASIGNDDVSKAIVEKEANEEIANLNDIIAKKTAIAEDPNTSVKDKGDADEVIKQARKAKTEANARIGMTHAQLQGLSSGDNDNQYKEDALEAIARIDNYTKEYNKLKDTYDYGTVESRQALGKLLENRMKRHTYEYALKSRAKKYATLFNDSTDVTEEDKNNYIARFKDLTHSAKLEIYHLRKKLEAIADEEYLNGGTQTATEFLKELNEYRANQINNDLQEIKNDPAKLAKYEEHRENHIAKLNKIKEELEGKKKPLVEALPIAEQQLQAQTDDAAKTKIEESINKSKTEIESLNRAIVGLDADIAYFQQDMDKFILAALEGQKEKEYRSKFVEKKLKALEDKQKQYEDSENRVNAIIEKLKNTKKEDIVEFNNLKNQLLNELKNSKFGFITLADLGLDPKQINGIGYEQLAELIDYQQRDFSLALAEALKLPEHKKLNTETLLKLEALDKDFEEMTSGGGHDKLVANAYELHKRQTKLFLDYQNESRSINENGGANISTPVASTPATNTQPTQAPERKNKYGITESKYLEYVNLEAIKQSYEQGIDSANQTIEEAEENIKNANGNKKLIIQNEQLIVDTKNKLDTYKSQLSEINKQIKAILKDSPFETINTEVEGLKSEVTNNRDKDITNSRKEDISINPDRWAKRQLVWRELFAAYDTYLKAIDDYKNASLENISTFGDALYNSRLNDLEQALSNARKAFEDVKDEVDAKFEAIDNGTSIEELQQKKIDDLVLRANTQKQKLDEYGKLYSKNSGTTKKLIARLQNELNDILSNIANVSIDDTKQLLDDIDTQTKAVVNSIYGTPMLKYLNNSGKSVFGNSDEVLAFLKELGLDSKNVFPLLSGAFENNLGLTITLTYDDESTVRGSYDFVKNEIELNAAYLQNAEQAREVLMHELVHALTRERFQDPKSGIVGKTIAVLDKWLGVLGISGIDSTVDKLTAIRDKVATNSKTLFNTFNNIIDAVRSGDETRLDELYAEAFSNKEFAELLKSQPIEGSYKPEGNYKVKGKTIRVKTSIWKKFMSVVLDGVANIITRIISDKPRQISILNELALILNDNPAFIETPEETTNKLAEEKVLEDKKVIEAQPQEPTNNIAPEQESDKESTIDLTKQTFVAVPVLDAPVDTSTKTSPNLASNIVENDLVKINTDNPFEPKQSILETFSANATPPEEEKVYPYIIDFTDEEFRDIETILNDVEVERKKLDILAESNTLLLEIEEEENALLSEIESNPESIEVINTILPSGAHHQLSIFTDEAQQKIDLINQNAADLQEATKIKTQQATDKVEKEKKKRNSKPKTPKQVSPNEVKNQSQEPANLPESGTIKADNDLGMPEATPVIVQPNGDGSNTILPAENNRISELPQPMVGAEPISTNAPNSSVLTGIEPSNTKTPERKDNAATASKEPVIDKEGIPIRGSKLEGDLLKANKDKSIVSNKLAITEEPNEKQAIRKVNSDGSLGEPLLPLFDKGTYDKGLTNKRKNQSAFVVSEEANTSPLELVKPDNENTSYTPGLSADMAEFEKWYEKLIDDEEKINKLSDIDFKDTPIADSDFYSNQNAILSILKAERIEDEAIRKNRIKLQYVAGNKRLAKAFNDTFGSKDNKGLSELSVDIIEDENKIIRVEKADSLEGTGWERSDDDTFVKTFSTIDDFLDNTDFLAFGQGKLNTIYSNSKEVTVIAMTNPLVENNSVRVILEDLSSSGALIVSGNFQNPNRFTKVTFTKQENGSTKVTLDFLNTDNKFAKAFKDDSLFDKSELATEDDFTLDYDIESYIDSNAAARKLMSNFATGLKNNREDAFELVTAKEKRVYLSNAEIKFTIKEVSNQTTSPNIFAKNKGKIVYYETQKNGVAKTYNFEDSDGDNTFKLLEEKLKRNKVKGKYIFVKLNDTYLPVKIKAKPLLSLKSEDTAFEKLMTNLENHLKDKTDVKSINEALITFKKNNIYVAHGLGDEKLYLNYELSDNGKRLKLKVGGEFVADHPVKKLSDIKEVIKTNIISDFKRVVSKLNNLYKNDERYEDLRNGSRYKNFNNNLFDNKSIILSPGDFKDVDSLLSFFDIPFDPLKPFSEVSFSYTGNKTFEALPEKQKIEETFTESPVVNEDIMEQTPERKMREFEITSDYLDANGRIKSDAVYSMVMGLKQEIDNREYTIDNDNYSLDFMSFDELSEYFEIKVISEYPTLSMYYNKDEFADETLSTAFFNSTKDIGIKFGYDGNFKDAEFQNNLPTILRELNDLISRLVIMFPKENEVKVNPEEISDDVKDREC